MFIFISSNIILLLVNVFSDVKVLLQNTLCDNECSVEVTVLAMEDDGRILVNVVTRYIESTTGNVWYCHLHWVPLTSNLIHKNLLVISGTHCKWTFLTLMSIRSDFS